jgi:adenosylcobinamide kinase / adenosylcobinamide-phosphate guanylyltransferase
MNSLPALSLVIGGAASGKSRFAEGLCVQSGQSKIYVATAQVYDEEMTQKVVRHLAQRGDNWTTIEAPIDVASALGRATKKDVVLIDCATLWLTNIILGDFDLEAETAKLLTAISSCHAPVVIVSNEVGQGIVPDNALSRKFRNAQGQLNQALAKQAELVVAVMAGLPLALKGAIPK